MQSARKPVFASTLILGSTCSACGKSIRRVPERFEGKRNKRFHVITAKILTNDYDATEADVPDDDDGLDRDGLF